MKRIAFISHSSADKAVAEEVCRFLETNGVLCWIAPRDVTPGKNYGAAILDAIDECSIFVLLLTAASNKSGQVVREVERAASSNSILIPFRVEDVQPSRDLEFYVSTTHWLDAVSKPFAKHLHELLKAIRNWEKPDETKNEVAAPVAASIPPTRSHPAPSRPFYRSGMFIIGILAVLFFCVVSAYLLLRHKAASVAQTPAPISTAAPAATPMTFESPSPTETPSSPEAIVREPPPESVAPSASPESMRRRPGRALVRSSPTPDLAPSASGAPSPIRSTPGPPLPATAASASPAMSAAVVREVAASSELRVNGQLRKASLAFDGNLDTAWVPEGDGIDKSLSVHFKSAATIASVSILAAVGGEQEFRSQNRLHTIRVTLSDGTNQVFTLVDKRKMQRFELAHPITADWAKFDILTVYRGKKSNHTPIFEIAFNRDDG